MLEGLVAALASYETVLEPDCNQPEWWAGAPSVARDDRGAFYLAARMRESESPKGKRGYEIRILKSGDGRHFEMINRLRREDAKVAGFERPAIVRDPLTGRFRLYGCTGLDRGWAILRFDDADDPSQFDASTARVVLQADHPSEDFAHVAGYKDPFLFYESGLWHMFVIGTDYIERAYHFVSEDGESWRAGADRPVLENTGWHTFFTRPACVVPMTVGYLFVYEGSSECWHDPVYNIATGLAYTPDLKTFVDLTPNEPLLKSTTPGECHTWRYSHWLPVDGRLYVYFEAARPNRTNEIRMAVI